jgi:hypothetical protein
MRGIPAPVRDVQSVECPESSEIVLIIGCDHHRISLVVVGHKGRIVNFDNNITGRIHVCELLLDSSWLVDEHGIPFSKAVSGQRIA